MAPAVPETKAPGAWHLTQRLQLVEEIAVGRSSLHDLVAKLDRPRASNRLKRLGQTSPTTGLVECSQTDVGQRTRSGNGYSGQRVPR